MKIVAIFDVDEEQLLSMNYSQNVADSCVYALDNLRIDGIKAESVYHIEEDKERNFFRKGIRRH